MNLYEKDIDFNIEDGKYERIEINNIQFRRDVTDSKRYYAGQWYMILDTDSDNIEQWLTVPDPIAISLELIWKTNYDERVVAWLDTLIEEDGTLTGKNIKKMEQAESRLQLLRRGLDLIKEYHARFEQEYYEF